ncbi:LmeA family phospholipid-binding protein [Streptomyces abikoensis]|uniref:LmeA family phospholipid-binding protein n=1 Tax=Streptomyces abikoensis TaxID=97398 RepID=UPI001E47145B|nr:DUF2993 domain-containing protein [Streptomyces abikoensis]
MPLAAARRHPVLVAAATLVALALGVTGADRAVAQYIQHCTADAFQQATGTPRAPQVTIDGFPVLSQVVAGRLNHVGITAHGIPAAPTDDRLPVTRLDLDLTGVRRSGDEQAARADSAKAGAFLSYDDLSSALGLGITAGDRPGYVDAQVLLPLVGVSTVTAKVSAGAANTIVFTDVHLTAGDLPDAGTQLLAKIFDQPIPLHNIPQGLHLDALRASASGLEAQLAGDNVTFRTGAPTASA